MARYFYSLVLLSSPAPLLPLRHRLQRSWSSTKAPVVLGDWFSAAQHVPFTSRDDGLPKVAIYGAGAAGNQLVAALRMGRVMFPVAFIDDDSGIAECLNCFVTFVGESYPMGQGGDILSWTWASP
jgi:FlaA1/EpsC-like NDP-sugar epimerase